MRGSSTGVGGGDRRVSRRYRTPLTFGTLLWKTFEGGGVGGWGRKFGNIRQKEGQRYLPFIHAGESGAGGST